LLEINIDNDNDMIEDRVIQIIKRKDPTSLEDNMYFFGPVVLTSSSNTCSEQNLLSTINAENLSGSVKISTSSDIQTSSSNGMQFFAGPREDPFFFDFTQYSQILGGSETGFNNPGTDTFAGTNVLSVVVEVPKSSLGSGVVGANPFAPTVPVYNVWVEAKRKQ